MQFENLGPLYVGPTTAAKLLNVSRPTLYRWINAGVIQSKRFGASRLRIPLAQPAFTATPTTDN